MQFSKTSKKTRKTAEETAALPEIATQGDSSNPRTTRSSKSKSTETTETASGKHHKPATKSLPVEQAAPALEPKAMAAAAGAYSAPQVTAQATSATQAGSNAASNPAVRHEEIAQLAYSYWVARGYAPGSPEQDWLRAEQELKAKL